MKDRNIALPNIRPVIPTLIEENVTSLSEQFQNKTLRPILKFQNELLLAIFQQNIQKRKNTFYQLSPSRKLEYINDNLRKDLKFRNLLIGIVIGHFTLDEWETYLQNENELNRRIITILTKRLQDQVEEFAISKH